MLIKFSDFVRRQTADSPFSHTTLSDRQVIEQLTQNLKHAKPTYRKYDKATKMDERGLLYGGVIAVPVDPKGFFSGVVQLQDGDVFQGEFKARRKGEAPRKQYSAQGEKIAAKSVDLILYHRDVLAEDEPDKDYPAEWEMVSINASPTLEETPIKPSTLMANHFHADGGTQTGLSDSEFVDKLRESFEFWQDKI
jgi:hypothetical protein